MKVWLVRIGEPLPMVDGDQRLFRMGLIAEQLTKAGVSVDWWTSSFNHNLKEIRNLSADEVLVKDGYVLQFLNGCDYKKNISLKRLIHYSQERKQFKKRIRHKEKPDIIYAAIPNIELAFEAVKYGKKKDVPVILDIRDMWPDIYADFYHGNNIFVKFGIELMRIPLKQALRNATGIFATSDKFLEWGLNYAKRQKTEIDDVFFVSYPDLKEPCESEIDFWRNLGISEKDFVCCFFGQFGHAVDLETVMYAAKELSQRESKAKFVICGVGEKLQSYKKITKGLENVVFPGWVNRKQIAALGSISDIGLLAYKNSKNYEWSMPNKFCEYLALGVYLMIQPSGEMEKLSTKYCCGEIYKNEMELADKIEYWSEHQEELGGLKKNSRRLYEERFCADVVYNDLSKKIISLADKYKEKIHEI